MTKQQAKRGSKPRPAPTRSELRRARKKANDLEKELTTMELSRDTYKADLETCKRELETLKSAHRETLEQLKAFEEVTKKLTESNERLEKEVANGASAQKTIADLERRLAEVSAAGTTLQRLTERQSIDLEEIPKLQTEATISRNEITSLKRSLEAADHGRREAQEHVRALEAQLKESHELQKILISSIQGKATIHVAQGDATIHMSDKMKVTNQTASPFDGH